MKYFILFIYCFFSFRLAAQFVVNPTNLPNEFPRYTYETTEQQAEGYLLFQGLASFPFLIILDEIGEIVAYQAGERQLADLKLQANGQFTYFDLGNAEHYVLDNRLVIKDTIHCLNGYEIDEHDLTINEQGNILLFCRDERVIDMSQIAQGGKPDAQVTFFIIQELDKDKNLLFEWDSEDHYTITDALRTNFTLPALDYVHGNSISYDYDGNILFSARHMDEITKINRMTGDIIWRLGGKNNQFIFVNDNLEGFKAQHHARRTTTGELTLFDNGFFHPTPAARAVAYELDEENKIATLTWQYQADPPIESRAMGSTQRLPNGNTLISWGLSVIPDTPNITEVTPTGEKAMELNFAGMNATYRAFKIPKDAINLDTKTGQASVLSKLFQLQLYPNPTTDQLMIAYKLLRAEKVTIQLYDAQGQRLATIFDKKQISGNHLLPYSCVHLPAGSYYVQWQSNKASEIKRFVVQ